MLKYTRMLRYAWLFSLTWLSLLSTLPTQTTSAQTTSAQTTSAQTTSERLSQDLEPWLECLTGQSESYRIIGQANPVIDGQARQIELLVERFDQESFDFRAAHAEYEVQLRRRGEGIAFALPKHNIVFLGRGQIDAKDHLSPAGALARLVGPGSSLYTVTSLLTKSSSEEVADALLTLTSLNDREIPHTWELDQRTRISFGNRARTITARVDTTEIQLEMSSASAPRAWDDWPGLTIQELPRVEIERQLARGIYRACEVLAPSRLLTAPSTRNREVEHGQLRWIDGQRVVTLDGTPEQMGVAHGQLLAAEAQRCIDSVLYSFGTVQTVINGRWFREDLQAAYARLAPHIPERHKVETRALARTLGHDEQLIEALNVFPELFHCSGFALFGDATKDGKLYHGRVLDYMTMIGLQDAATTFIVKPEGFIPFANVGYAGFIGSVSGMNAEKISLGEMGGRGEGQWDGAPMATLMRRGLEECDSLAKVMHLFESSPRTCEYYYVFADGEDRSAVGVAATPEKIEFVKPGQSDPRLGDGIRDAVVLSAGSRLDELRSRVKEKYGQIDASLGQWLMCRPVAMSSNLHNVLFVPEDGVLYVANADHRSPAAERPYVKLDLHALLGSAPAAPTTEQLGVHRRFPATDTLAPAEEALVDSQDCLKGLLWQPAEFEVSLEMAQPDKGDWLVRFPSARPSGDLINDTVALEWYLAKDDNGQPVRAPAAVIVHESGKGMTVGRLIAKGLRQRGLHTFMIQLPYYGVRRQGELRPTGDSVFAAMRQAIADVRRAKDAVAALPLVDAERISLQGTSLGGFVTATTAGLDSGFHRVVIFLAGGDLYDVLMQGKQDAANMREELSQRGVDNDTVKQLLHAIEPLRLAHRITPERTWMFSGVYDDVVPIKNCNLLADAAGLAPSHHVKLLANHYSGIIFLPMVLSQMRDIMIQP